MYGSGGVGSPISRDNLGRITAMNETINGATHSWLMAYDVRGRLESVTLDGNTSVYGYDPNGNLTAINGTTFGTYDAQDRMVTLTPPAGSTWTLSYTNNGDLTCKTDRTQDYAFDYDLSSNLRSVQVNAAISAGISYVIDGTNRRIGKAITPSIGSSSSDGLLYDEQGRVVAELDGSGNVLSTFVHGLKPNVPDYMVRGGTAYRIVSDWRGDVRLVLNTTETGLAAVVQQVDYDAWGNVVNLLDPDCTVGGTALCFQPFGFAGGLWEPSTGVVRFGARDYDPAAGRWQQKDPIGFGGGINLYEYSWDEPINQVDPRGTSTYICIAPLQSLGFIPPGQSPLFHSYICVIQGSSIICGSFNPSGGMFGSPGQNDPNDQFNPANCSQTSPDNTCLEDCVATIAENPASYPFYDVISYNCHDWTEDVFNYCNSACSQ